MNKNRIIKSCFALLLILSGCSSTAVKEGDKYAVASLNGENILADDLYDELRNTTNGKNALFSYVLDGLIAEYFPVTDAMEKDAQTSIDNIKANYESQYGDEWEDALNSALAQEGVKDLDAYKETLISSLQYAEFIKQYVKDNFDEVFEDYYKTENPRYVEIIKISVANMEEITSEENEKLNEVKSLLKTDKAFGDIAADYSDDDSYQKNGQIGLVDTKTFSDAEANIADIVFKLKEGEVSDAIEASDGYYFVHCTSTNKEEMKKELEKVDINSPLLDYDDYILYLAFNTYDVTYGDEETEKLIKEYIDEALDARKEGRGEKE